MKQKELSPGEARKISGLLLRWFNQNKRDLPWRKTNDPYKIWISEVMLQQTQVNKVIPYYNRWIKNFPRVQVLANAPLSKVLKLWEGLGYYSRARNLHNAAKMVVRNWGGRFPSFSDELQKLPGIGQYTAGAVLSIAFGRPEPILDGNVKRVLSRILALKKPIDKSSGEKILWETAKRLVESGSPCLRREKLFSYKGNFCGDLNQSLMELGRLVCVPENPKCPACPIENMCAAHQLRLEEKLPVRSRKKKRKTLRTLALVLWKDGRVLLEKQPLHARWGGLWMFPHWIHENGAGETVVVHRKAKESLGIRLDGLKKQMEIRHGFTKYRVRLQVYESRVAIASPAERETLRLRRWVFPEKLSNFALPSPHQKIAEWIKGHA